MAELKITACVLKQNGEKFYLFPMRSDKLDKVCYVTPRSEGNPQEIQRLVNTQRLRDIGEYVQKKNSFLPNAIVISLCEDVKIEEISPSQALIIFPNDEEKVAYILDGQHRLKGFEYSDGVVFDLPVVALYNASVNTRGKIFADINSLQVKVSDVHILSLYYQLRELPDEKLGAMPIVSMLNEDPDSLLQGNIKVLDDEKGKWFKNTHVVRCIKSHVNSGGCLYGRTAGEQTKILKDFIRGISATWPSAWGNTKEYSLTSSMGFQIIMDIFPTVLHRCDLNEGQSYTAEAFERQLSSLRNATIKVPAGVLYLDWSKGTLATYSNRVGITLLTRELIDILNVTDRNSDL